VGRCRVRHWLLRVLTAEDVRRGLEEGLADTAAALQELMDADGAADVVSFVCCQVGDECQQGNISR